jgi:hypothetical protein
MTPANYPSASSPALVGDLEMRINTERTLDLFTMFPKVSFVPTKSRVPLMFRNANCK